MKATRKTIPTLIEKREEFVNTSGTLRGIKEKKSVDFNVRLALGGTVLNADEKSRLLIDHSRNGISYVIVSYDTPIGWETENGYIYKVSQELSQTSEQHKGLLYLFHQR